MSDRIVVVGAGQAAASLASRHIATGAGHPMVLIGEEPVAPYQRPPLSKAYLLGKLDRERLNIRQPSWFEESGITTMFGSRVESIVPERKQVVLSGGETVPYGTLVLCTGSTAKRLPDSLGGTLEGVHTLRTLADADALSPILRQQERILIIGGGYIGLEVAAAARMLGMEVVILEVAERILQRVASPVTSDFFRDLHTRHGVQIREATRLARLVGSDNRVCAAELETGERIETGLVLVGIGNDPNTALAEQAGIACENGVCVDASCRTSDPAVLAAGDCTSFIRNGRRIRLESVQNASDQGDLVARVMAGENTEYSALPWFWSEQYDCTLQIAGLNQGHDRVCIRPGQKEYSQSVWYYAGGTLLAVDAMNDVKSYAFGRRLIEMGISPAPEQVADPGIDLKALVKAHL